ncbi:transcriptional regulator [Nocardia sp. 348MFTsu5.1]|uniref:transcriptional regulator n=1 Tax=Nocardia sp. 348MFTsu5.1 TaxID=1172185 RepID=UPI0003A74C44|nr:transcriptional regulator [Nocardia sp. 348MFTsu5.1]
MYVLTIDQRRSRSEPDRVPEALAALAGVTTIRPFDRTAGDELQAVLDDPEAVTEAVGILASDGHWSIGVGIGDVELPLPEQTRAGRGQAFERAREAVNSAKTTRYHVSVVGSGGAADGHAQTALRLLVRTATGRSAAGQEAIREMRLGHSQSEAAATLGITPQAISQRLQAADWHIEEDTRVLATHLLEVAHP